MTGLAALAAAGFGLGVSVAAPLGPVSAAAIREGLERGALPTFLIGLGAARRAAGGRPWVYQAVNLVAGLALGAYALVFLWRAFA